MSGEKRSRSQLDGSASSDASRARCSIQRQICALFVEEEEQEHLLEQNGDDREAHVRRSAFVDEILNVRAIFYKKLTPVWIMRLEDGCICNTDFLNFHFIDVLEPRSLDS